MSQRIRRALGYGVEDVRTLGMDGYGKAFNPQDVLQRANELNASDVPEEFAKRLPHELVSIQAAYRDIVTRDLSFPLFAGPDEEDFEDSEPRPVVVVPLECPRWFRYDDAIDYHEFPDPGVKFHVGPLHPYLSWIRFAPSLIEHRHSNEKVLQAGDYNRAVGRWDPALPALGTIEEVGDLLTNWRPSIPLSVYVTLLCAGVSDPLAAFNRLRPMILTYYR